MVDDPRYLAERAKACAVTFDRLARVWAARDPGFEDLARRGAAAFSALAVTYDHIAACSLASSLESVTNAGQNVR